MTDSLQDILTEVLNDELRKRKPTLAAAFAVIAGRDKSADKAARQIAFHIAQIDKLADDFQEPEQKVSYDDREWAGRSAAALST